MDEASRLARPSAPALVLPGIDRPVSRVILGMSARAADLPGLWDRYVELGGNALDSAHSYPNEVVLGRWLAGRADRDELVVIGKAGHPHYDGGPPRIHPEEIESDLLTSLDQLGRARIDLFLLHRDDETLPDGEIMTALAEHRIAGRVGATGASNWTTERLTEANTWAAANGVPPFDASSPNLTLATPIRPPWPGCVIAGDPTSLAWYRRTRLPLISWSPLARGYFSDPSELDDIYPDATRSFDSADNRARRTRARTLAVELGVSPNQVALAWLLNQPFPTWATVGATTISQLEESLGATTLSLSAEQVLWLATGDPQADVP